MLASELLAELQTLMAQYGDLPVLSSDNGSVSDTSSVELLSRENVESVILISGRAPSYTATVFNITPPHR